MAKFTPISHQFTLFDYNAMRPKMGLPPDVKKKLIKLAERGKIAWKNKNAHEVSIILSDMQASLERLESRIINKRKH